MHVPRAATSCVICSRCASFLRYPLALFAYALSSASPMVNTESALPFVEAGAAEHRALRPSARCTRTVPACTGVLRSAEGRLPGGIGYFADVDALRLLRIELSQRPTSPIYRRSLSTLRGKGEGARNTGRCRDGDSGGDREQRSGVRVSERKRQGKGTCLVYKKCEGLWGECEVPK